MGPEYKRPRYWRGMVWAQCGLRRAYLAEPGVSLWVRTARQTGLRVIDEAGRWLQPDGHSSRLRHFFCR